MTFFTSIRDPHDILDFEKELKDTFVEEEAEEETDPLLDK
jgi:hypothetical protein